MSKEVTQTLRQDKGQSLMKFLDTYIVLDLETTGLDPTYDEIIEVAALKYVHDELVDTFVTLVNPDNRIDAYITKLTGISNDMVQDAPKIRTVLPELKIFLGDLPIVAHNANFDINFLYDNFMFCMEEPLTNDFVDTMRISRQLFKEMRHRLVDLVNAFNIRTSNLHRAQADCEATQQVYEYMKAHCLKNNIDISTFKTTSYSRKINLSALVSNAETVDESHPIYGKAVCFTGKLEKFQRKEALQLVVNLGGIPMDSVNMSTNILVLGNNDYSTSIKGGKSSKQKKAEELILRGQDLIIISEKTFYDML